MRYFYNDNEPGLSASRLFQNSYISRPDPRDRIEKDTEAMEIPRAQRNPARPGLARIVSVVCKLTQTTEEALHRQQRRGARLIVTWLGRHFHYSHRETGEVLGVGRAAAGRLEAVTDSQMEKDKSLRTFVTRCLSELK